MNTERSERNAAEFLKNGKHLERKTLTYERMFSFPPEEVFPQFCPSRELDWIQGWDADLVYTSTGYVEPDVIFTTSENNPFGPGIWIFTRYEPNEKLELVRVMGDMVVIHFRIDLRDNHDGTSTGIWNIKVTALNETGNQIVESIGDTSPEVVRATEGLEYFLKTGELLTD